ncbi:MAG: 5-oxoprolinase subunit PxpB [Gemmatimonadales bacterium]|nr:5-oxoprolinase subunit PxpB [Gemmatimonadales bacterium]
MPSSARGLPSGQPPARGRTVPSPTPPSRASSAPSLAPLGDSAVRVSFGDLPDPATRRRLAAAAARLAADPCPGQRDVVPGATTLTIHLDPAVAARAGDATPYAAVHAHLRDALTGLDDASAPAARAIRLPVCLDDAFAPDLADVAAATGLAPDEVRDRLLASPLEVEHLGFLPGFPYLIGLDAALTLPRRATPRPLVPAGSLAIAAGRAGVYPVASPGGWHLLGRTPLRLFDPARAEPALLAPGDRVRLEAIDAAEFARRAGRGA